MRTCIITSFSDNNRRVFDLSVKNHEAYCVRHDYVLLNLRGNYDPYVDVETIRKMLTDFDVVATVGADLLIVRPELELSRFVTTGVAMGREYRSELLNGDFIIYHRDDATDALLSELDKIQKQFPDGQTALNRIFKLDPERCGIKPVADLQVAFPEMNPRHVFDAEDVERSFSLHFHTMGERPDVNKKANYMETFLRERDEKRS